MNCGLYLRTYKMWVVVCKIAFIVSMGNDVHAMKSSSDTTGISHLKDKNIDNIPSVGAFSVKQANNPTVTSFTEELQYPGIGGSKDGYSIEASPTLENVSKTTF